MDKTNYGNPNNDAPNASMGSAVGDILQASKKRRLVIRNRDGKKVIDISVLLAVILSIGAPVLPIFVILGVQVEAIRVSIEDHGEKPPTA